MTIESWGVLLGILVPTTGAIISAYLNLSSRISKLESGQRSIEQATSHLDRDNREMWKLFEEQMRGISERLGKLETVSESIITLAAEVKYHHASVNRFIDLAFARLDQHDEEIQYLSEKKIYPKNSRRRPHLKTTNKPHEII